MQVASLVLNNFILKSYGGAGGGGVRAYGELGKSLLFEFFIAV